MLGVIVVRIPELRHPICPLRLIYTVFSFNEELKCNLHSLYVHNKKRDRQRWRITRPTFADIHSPRGQIEINTFEKLSGITETRVIQFDTANICLFYSFEDHIKRISVCKTCSSIEFKTVRWFYYTFPVFVLIYSHWKLYYSVVIVFNYSCFIHILKDINKTE